MRSPWWAHFTRKWGFLWKMPCGWHRPFGGGMGGMRETCGAVTGMFLVAGMLKGYDDPADYDGKKAHYARIRELAEQFRQKHDTLVCRELLQALPGKLKQDPQPRTEEYYKVRPCVRFVETAAELLEEMLEEA